MTEIRKLWNNELPPVPEKELEAIKAVAGVTLWEAAGCFWLFRFLHRYTTAPAVLMGDYCFGCFSKHLASLDSVELTNAFAAFLKEDTVGQTDIDFYLSFIKRVSRMT